MMHLPFLFCLIIPGFYKNPIDKADINIYNSY